MCGFSSSLPPSGSPKFHFDSFSSDSANTLHVLKSLYFHNHFYIPGPQSLPLFTFTQSLAPSPTAPCPYYLPSSPSLLPSLSYFHFQPSPPDPFSSFLTPVCPFPKYLGLPWGPVPPPVFDPPFPYLSQPCLQLHWGEGSEYQFCSDETSWKHLSNLIPPPETVHGAFRGLKNPSINSGRHSYQLPDYQTVSWWKRPVWYNFITASVSIENLEYISRF